MNQLPFSQACENNKPFILEELLEVFAGREQILEIASGSGQHACHFAENMPWLLGKELDLFTNSKIQSSLKKNKHEPPSHPFFDLCELFFQAHKKMSQFLQLRC